MDESTNIERIRIPVVAGTTITHRHRTRNGNKRIVGMMVQADDGVSSLEGNKLRMVIDKNELLPANFDPALLTFDQSTPVNGRWHKWINIPIHESEIIIDYTDNQGSGAGVSIYLKCTQNEQ